MQENVKKCKNFLATLIKLASHNSPSPETSKNVKALVQDLLVSVKPTNRPCSRGLTLLVTPVQALESKTSSAFHFLINILLIK